MTGQDSTGDQVNYVSADANGNMFVKDYADGASGSAAPSVTTQVGGSDGTDLRTFATDTSGRLKVLLNDGSGNSLSSTSNALNTYITNTTIAVTQSTSPWITKDQSDGPVTPGTVASFSQLIGGQYNSTLPTLTTGQQSAFQIDSSGRIILSPTTTLTAGVADKTSFTYGTTIELPVGGVYNDTSPTLSSGTTGALRLNVNRALHSTLRDPTTDVGVTTTAINSKQRLDVNLPSEGTDGATAPFDAIQVGGKDSNGDLQTLATDTSGDLYVVGNIASAATDSGNPVKVGAIYSATLPTVTTGQRVNAQANQFGELSVQFRNKYKNITTSGATVVKTGSGRLHGISFSQNSGITVTVYDNTAASGTVIALFQSQNMIFVGPLGCEFATGLTINQSGSNNITVYYE